MRNWSGLHGPDFVAQMILVITGAGDQSMRDTHRLDSIAV